MTKDVLMIAGPDVHGIVATVGAFVAEPDSATLGGRRFEAGLRLCGYIDSARRILDWTDHTGPVAHWSTDAFRRGQARLNRVERS